jgi:hypothetical protein
VAESAAERLDELRHGFRRVLHALNKDDVAEAKWLLTVMGTLLDRAVEAELRTSHPPLPPSGGGSTDSAG